MAKAYTTAVGEGPFPSEQLGPMGDYLRQQGGEYGVVTGRPGVDARDQPVEAVVVGADGDHDQRAGAGAPDQGLPGLGVDHSHRTSPTFSAPG